MRSKEAKRTTDRVYYQAHREERLAAKRAYRQAHREQTKAYDRSRYEARREKRKTYMQSYLRSHRKEIAAQKRLYDQSHRGKKKAYDQVYRQAHFEKIKVQHRAYHQAHKEQHAAHVRRRKALQMGLGHQPYKVDDIFQRDRGVCGLCGKRVAKADRSIDHILPLSLGGADAPHNVQLAHRRCNLLKKNSARFPANLRLALA